MVVYSIVILSVCLHAAFCLPVLPDSPDQWDFGQLGADDIFPSRYPSRSNSRSNLDAPLNDFLRPRFDTSHRAHTQHAHRRAPEGFPLLTKRQEQPTEEESNIPTMGLGVLSNLPKFFTELRTNLESVEEAAALSQEMGNFKNGKITPADFLAFLAKHAARSAEFQSGEAGLPRNKAPMRSFMLGYNHDDQPYAHTGLGK